LVGAARRAVHLSLALTHSLSLTLLLPVPVSTE
jgi:hypothetical protein